MSMTRRQIAFGALGGGVLTGCGTLPSALGETSADRLARIGSALGAEVDKHTFAGAVSIVARGGRLVHHEAVGFLDAAKTRPMTRDALFRWASMTKPVTSVAALMLVEQGRMKLSDPITDWMPELRDLRVETPSGDVPLARPVTVQDLLMHTSGFVYGRASPSPRIGKMHIDLDIEALATDLSSDEMLRRLGTIPLAFQPGTTWNYSISTDVLGLLIERVVRQRLDAHLQQTLLGPLGMEETAWWVSSSRRGRLAEALDSDPLKTPMLSGYRTETDPAERTYLKGGDGLIGPGTDYLRFAQMVLRGGTDGRTRYLSRKTVEFMLADHLAGIAGAPTATTGPGYGFGLGWGVRLRQGGGWAPGSVGDAMWAGIWGTSFWIDPREQLVGILMVQAPATRIHTRILMKNLVYGAVS
ncbi:serine hydrolase domain-containing protein [Variovorax sp. ZT4R33]|uniref:serine hydrolase domain-containing protein n=1 Tax=Variovorax sp. ZT4R33 TaxID=3443743 RepID=UPI003F48F5F1